MADPVELAVAFLAEQVDRFGALDRFGAPRGPRLPRSYRGGPLDDLESSFVYDDALVVLALLPSSPGHAVAVAEALLLAQTRDPAADGRVRNSYLARPFDGVTGPVAAERTSTTGNQAWVGLAWIAVAEATGESRYIDAAHRIARWVHDTQWAPGGIPGYTGGFGADGSRFPWKSTEHHADLAALFSRLGAATGQADWFERASACEAFARGMRVGPNLCTGVAADGVARVLRPVPLDAQVWSVLAGVAEPGLLDWAARSLAATDSGPTGVSYTGVSYSDADRSGIWFEGTSHLALALRLRRTPGDEDAAAVLRATVRAAQQHGRYADGRGIPAASRDGLGTGFGDAYTASLHTGATAWAVLSERSVNPLARADRPTG